MILAVFLGRVVGATFFPMIWPDPNKFKICFVTDEKADSYYKVKDKNTVESLSISQALALARKKFKRNLLFDALDICDDILKTFPDNKGSKDLIKKITTDRSAEILADTCFQDGNSLYPVSYTHLTLPTN